MTPNQTIWDIDKFADGSISEGELERLKESLLDIQEELEEQRREADLTCARSRRKKIGCQRELKELEAEEEGRSHMELRRLRQLRNCLHGAMREIRQRDRYQ
ncbi:MAG: hypothetical protein ACLTLQ_03455 [[Clostridium] scindens]